jgi:hypothetical protein
MDPREAEFLLKYFTDLNKIDIPINVKDNSFGGRLSRLGSRIGTPVKNFINRKASIPNLLTPRSSTIPNPWGGSLTSSPVVNTLGGEVVDVAASAPKSFLGRIRSLPSGVTNRFAGNPAVKNILLGTKNPVVMQIGGNPVVKGAIGVGSKVLSLPAQLAYSEFFEHNPYADPNNPELYMKGPGSLEHALAHGGFIEEEELPNTYQPLPTHIEENRGPEHLITGKGPSHLSDAVDNFLTNREEWEQGTQNSPARSSGVFTDDELWALQQKHRDWKAARGR